MMKPEDYPDYAQAYFGIGKYGKGGSMEKERNKVNRWYMNNR